MHEDDSKIVNTVQAPSVQVPMVMQICLTARLRPLVFFDAIVETPKANAKYCAALLCLFRHLRSILLSSRPDPCEILLSSRPDPCEILLSSRPDPCEDLYLILTL